MVQRQQLPGKVKDFVLDLLDNEIEETNKALNWEGTPFTKSDIDKLVESRVYFTDTEELDGRAERICWNWFCKTVDKTEPLDIADCTEYKEEATYECVGAVYMLIKQAVRFKDAAADTLMDAWEYLRDANPSGSVYRKYLDNLVGGKTWDGVDFKDIKELVMELDAQLVYARQGWGDGTLGVIVVIGKLMEVQKLCD